ncbi:hypothetical protein V5O48_012778 [Marasmius crinis-equi]|uniref:Ferritin-like domain-containing protein n=1 Tax=Marasmius crinis-equi TaxID=585013 RepID=A0ABR3F1W6_9AGAR
MRYSTLFALAAPLAVHAAPLSRRQDGNLDVTILKFADVLEQLESKFYADALAKFQTSDFTNAGFASSDVPIQQFQVIQSDEATHSTVLQSGLAAVGESPVTSCKFKFDSALTDVATMAATARVVEMVGVGAYLGAAPLVTDPVILQAAGSILTVEARHSTVLNLLSGSGTSVPAPFDIALAPSEVLSVAAPFFDGPCDLGVPAFPTLAITNTDTVAPGTKLEFKSDAINGTVPEDSLFCQMLLGGAASSIPLPFTDCVVPPDVNGPVAVFVTADGQPLVSNTKDRQTNNGKLLAGPALAFIDTQPQLLGQMLRSSGTSGGSQTTQTISPEQASKVIEGASATGTASDGASSTTASDGSAPTGSSTPVNNGVNNGGKPNLSTGPSQDGSINVLGWTGL